MEEHQDMGIKYQIKEIGEGVEHTRVHQKQ
jgi:hypothetical protein